MHENISITVEVVKGGFVLHYPVKMADFDHYQMQREIFTSSRKMNQRMKEVLEAVSTTPVDAD